MNQTNLHIKDESQNRHETNHASADVYPTITRMQVHSGSPDFFPDQQLGKDPPNRWPRPVTG